MLPRCLFESLPTLELKTFKLHLFSQMILQFILDNGRCKDTGGIALWQLMEEMQVMERGFWQS
jgi:hypothetical protein